MANLQLDQIADVVITSLDELNRDKWTDFSTSLQEFIFIRNILDKERVVFDSGIGINWTVHANRGNVGIRTGLYATDNVNVPDLTATASTEYAHYMNHWAWDIRQIPVNSGAARIVDELRIKENDARSGLFEKLEADAWSKPSSSTVNDQMFGFDYWLKYNATTGFNGGHPTGFTDVAGLSVDTHANWKNFTGNYTNVTPTDFVRLVRRGLRFTHFRSPVPVNNPGGNNPRRGLYTNYDVISPLEELLQAQNDNLGNDLASKDGKTMIKSVQVFDVPELDGKTGNPVYGIDWSSFRIAVLSGNFFRETGPAGSNNAGSGQHNVLKKFIDISLTPICYNRRANFIFATADPAP